MVTLAEVLKPKPVFSVDVYNSVCSYWYCSELKADEGEANKVAAILKKSGKLVEITKREVR